MLDTVAGASRVARAMSACETGPAPGLCWSSRITRRWLAARSEAVEPGAGPAAAVAGRGPGSEDMGEQYGRQPTSRQDLATNLSSSARYEIFVFNS